ncbi:hypothetical protein ABK040_010786 [Willaertia magna]
MSNENEESSPTTTLQPTIIDQDEDIKDFVIVSIEKERNHQNLCTIKKKTINNNRRKPNKKESFKERMLKADEYYEKRISIGSISHNEIQQACSEKSKIEEEEKRNSMPTNMIGMKELLNNTLKLNHNKEINNSHLSHKSVTLPPNFTMSSLSNVLKKKDNGNNDELKLPKPNDHVNLKEEDDNSLPFGKHLLRKTSMPSTHSEPSQTPSIKDKIANIESKKIQTTVNQVDFRSVLKKKSTNL